MSAILTKFFLSNPFVRRTVIRDALTINEVSPNLYENLQQYSKNFIQAVISKDAEYITGVCCPELGKKISTEIKFSQNVNYNDTFYLQGMKLEEVKKFQIFPYVVFGEDIKQRFKKDNCFINNFQLGSNKFLYNPPNVGFLQKLQMMRRRHIYGFNCIYEPKWYVYNTNGQNVTTHRSHQFMISFQTDSENIDFWITDCQGFQLQESKLVQE